MSSDVTTADTYTRAALLLCTAVSDPHKHSPYKRNWEEESQHGPRMDTVRAKTWRAGPTKSELLRSMSWWPPAPRGIARTTGVVTRLG